MSVCGHECHQWAADGLCDWYGLHHQHEAVPHDLLHAVPAMTAVQCGAVRRHGPTGARRAKRPKRTDETVAKSLLPKTTAGMVLHASVQWALCVLTVGQRRAYVGFAGSMHAPVRERHAAEQSLHALRKAERVHVPVSVLVCGASSSGIDRQEHKHHPSRVRVREGVRCVLVYTGYSCATSTAVLSSAWLGAQHAVEPLDSFGRHARAQQMPSAQADRAQRLQSTP